ncbi:uL13 family ribosomal protein [Candidatus Parcubacteria bacterium]|nr:uL13 family ribosomal protein [Candidatus Parcubacteria bacterium]
MPVDKKIIYRKIKFINKDLSSLMPFSQMPLEEYLAKGEYEVLAERYLERIIGRMIDINYHILSEAENQMPDDYFNSFIDMGKKNYLPMGLAESLKNSAGLRNRLAHEYDEIDEKKILKAIKITGRKIEQKKYNHHTGYLGGLKAKSLKTLIVENPAEVLKKAVFGMLPNSKLRAKQIKRLKFSSS